MMVNWLDTPRALLRLVTWLGPIIIVTLDMLRAYA